MKVKLFSLLVSTALLSTVACSSEEAIPKPGDADFIGPILEETINEEIPQPGDPDFIGPLLEVGEEN